MPAAVPAPQFETATIQGKVIHGDGLPGRVWSTGKPGWITDVTRERNFRRATIAKREGLHGAFGFPIKLGDKILGVVEGFSREVREPDDHFLQMVGDIGDQLGRFIEHRRAEDDLRQTKDKLVSANAELEREEFRSARRILRKQPPRCAKPSRSKKYSKGSYARRKKWKASARSLAALLTISTIF